MEARARQVKPVPVTGTTVVVDGGLAALHNWVAPPPPPALGRSREEPGGWGERHAGRRWRETRDRWSLARTPEAAMHADGMPEATRR